MKLLRYGPRGADKPAPSAPFRTDALLGTAAQTNQWYSALIFSEKHNG